MTQTIKYAIDAQGNYLGAYVGTLPPVGSIEVPHPPEHGLQKYDRQTKKWSDLAEARGDHREAALMALNASDITVLRLLENGITIPSDWKDYRKELRKIAKGEKKEKPPREPKKPDGI